MIIGIGIDIIEVGRIDRQLKSEVGLPGDLFTPGEINYCRSKRDSAQFFAARFAAKEAFLKALGTGQRDGISFGDVEVINDRLGKPALVLHRSALEKARIIGITQMHLSLSHIKDYATAMVTLET